MEAEPAKSLIKKITNDEINTREKKQISSYMPFPFFIFPSIWIRCFVPPDNGVDRILLDNGYNFLLYIGGFFWTLFLFFGH